MSLRIEALQDARCNPLLLFTRPAGIAPRASFTRKLSEAGCMNAVSDLEGQSQPREAGNRAFLRAELCLEVRIE